MDLCPSHITLLLKAPAGTLPDADKLLRSLPLTFLLLGAL